MVNKKISGQTVAIIILAILLLIAIGFGGVYAYYSARSKKLTGTVVMANLNIALVAEEYADSAKSEIVISHGTNFVPGQELKNSALNIVNSSAKNVPVYLIVVYEIKATKMDEKGNIIPGEVINDEMYKPLIDLGAAYINPEANLYYEKTTNSNWVDYVYTFKNGSEVKQYRCLVTTSTWSRPNDNNQVIPVIEENQLRLHRFMNDDYQRTSLAFAFQAYAIGAGEGSELDFADSVTQAEKCNAIVSAIYESVEYKFFEGTVNQQGAEKN